MTSLTDLLHALTLCPPEQVCAHASVTADWLEEHGDERCGVVRKIVAKGPVDAGQPGCPMELRFTNNADGARFWCYRGDTKKQRCRACDCGPQFGDERPVWTCRLCRTVWFVPDTTQADAAREFLHRLRVECLCHFYDELPDKLAMKIDGRWPTLRVAIDDGKLTTVCVSDCMMAFSAVERSDGESQEMDDLAGYAAPESEVIRRPAHLQRQDYQPPPPRGRAYTASDRQAFRKRVEKRRARKRK